MNYLLGNLLPSFAIVEDAGHHDSKRAEAVTANLGDGDVLVADRAYTDFGFLNALALRNVFFVVREKTNLVMEALEALQDPVKFNTDFKAWDGRWVEIGRGQAEALVFAGFSAVLAVSNGTASRQILGNSGTWSRLSENLSRNFIP